MSREQRLPVLGLPAISVMKPSGIRSRQSQRTGFGLKPAAAAFA